MMRDVDSLAPRTFVAVCEFGYITEMTQHLSTTQKALVSRRMAAPNTARFSRVQNICLQGIKNSLCGP